MLKKGSLKNEPWGLSIKTPTVHVGSTYNRFLTFPPGYSFLPIKNIIGEGDDTSGPVPVTYKNWIEPASQHSLQPSPRWFYK